tara:strand:+ start:55 stop:564 length:510 start_codon:yes stop_codon:yes gene_type:complete
MNDSQLIWEAYLKESVQEWYYTIVHMHGTHGELSTVIKTLGHVPDEKVKAMVEYYVKEYDDPDGGSYEDFSDYEDYDMSDYSPEEQEQWKKPGWNFMSTMYDSIGIPVAAGVWHLNSGSVGLVKHPKPPKPIADGDKDWEADPDSRYGYRSTWAPKNWNSGEDGTPDRT